MKLRNKLIATIVSISMVLAVIGVGAWASTESFTATITNTVSLEFDNIKGQILAASEYGADNISENVYEGEDPSYLEEYLYDGENVIYDQISSSATSGTNLYWEGTKFLDSSDEGLQLVNNETQSACLCYTFVYFPTEDCVGTSSITAMITETSHPEISGGKLMVKYFASTDEQYLTEINSGEAITPINDNEFLIIIAVCQYYNLDGVSISTIESAWDFNLTFSAGRTPVTPLTGRLQFEMDISNGVWLPYNYTSQDESPWEIIEFGEYPQTLKASNVTITSTTPDADGYYPGSDGARYAKLTASSDVKTESGFQMQEGSEYYFKVEPIKWRTVPVGGNQYVLMSDMALDAKAYQTQDPVTAYGAPEGTYRSSYEYSELRQFLNGEFYTKAFSDAEKQQILYNTIQNDDESAGGKAGEFAGNATQDYVFIPSFAELTNEYFGFNADEYAQDTARKWEVTDYAKAAGVGMITPEWADMVAGSVTWDVVPYIGSAFDVWTRSPAAARGAGQDVCMVLLGMVRGSVDYYAAVDSTSTGVAPALVITR